MSNQDDGRGGLSHAVTDDTFDELVLGSSLPVLVDVWAEWCGPCRQVSPVVERLAGEYAGRLVVATVDADANPGVVERMGVVSIPTLAVYRDSALAESMIGAHPAAEITAMVERVLP